jgi:hypothetical protein
MRDREGKLHSWAWRLPQGCRWQNNPNGSKADVGQRLQSVESGNSKHAFGVPLQARAMHLEMLSAIAKSVPLQASSRLAAQEVAGGYSSTTRH